MLSFEDKELISRYKNRFGDVKPSTIPGSDKIQLWTCPECNGEGVEHIRTDDGRGNHDVPCKLCLGRGKLDHEPRPIMRQVGWE